MPCWHYQIYVAQAFYDMIIFDNSLNKKNTTTFEEGEK
jgi:hypothetical protein